VEVSPVSVIILLNVAGVLLALSLVVGGTGVKVKVGPVSIIVLLFRSNVAGVLLSLALVVGGAGVKMEISPVSIIVLLFGSNVAGVLLSLALVVASQKLTASVLLALALVMGLTSLKTTGDKRGNQVVCSDWSTTLVLVSICSGDVGVVKLTAMRASTAFLDALLFSGTT
jgi:lysylphosphatidylglycerol synthetase-like protein (DUF2156 family)